MQFVVLCSFLCCISCIHSIQTVRYVLRRLLPFDVSLCVRNYFLSVVGCSVIQVNHVSENPWLRKNCMVRVTVLKFAGAFATTFVMKKYSDHSAFLGNQSI